MYQFTSKIKCLNCGKSNYRGKTQRNKKVYTCANYQKNGASACTNYVIPEEELIHIVSTHLKLKNVRVEGSLGEHVSIIEVSGRGYKIYYNDGSNSVVNDNSSEYGTKFKY